MTTCYDFSFILYSSLLTNPTRAQILAIGGASKKFLLKKMFSKWVREKFQECSLIELERNEMMIW